MVGSEVYAADKGQTPRFASIFLILRSVAVHLYMLTTSRFRHRGQDASVAGIPESLAPQFDKPLVQLSFSAAFMLPSPPKVRKLGQESDPDLTITGNPGNVG